MFIGDCSMIHEEILGGVAQAAPPIISEQEATFNAGFARYDYDPGARSMMMDQYMNPPASGLGAPPPQGMRNPLLNQQYYQPYQPFQPFQPQPNPYYYNQYNEAAKVFIKPCCSYYNNNEYMPLPDMEDRINSLINKYINKYEEQQIDQSMNNAYGSIGSEIQREVESLKSEARENRIEFYKMLSQTAHKFANESIDEEEIDRRYRGMYVDMPGYSGATYLDVSNQEMLARLVPVNNTWFYQEQFRLASEDFHKIIPADATAAEFFNKSGILKAKYDMEDEMHRRNNASNLYNDNAYRSFLRAKAIERRRQNNQPVQQPYPYYPLQNMETYNGMKVVPNGIPDEFPTLKENAVLTEDGTLNIVWNFGNNKGQVYKASSVQEEAEYEKSRERFQKFYNSIPGSFGLTDPNPEHNRSAP